MKININPLNDRVVVKSDAAEIKTASGIYITETAQEKPQKGTIVAVGPGKYADVYGVIIPMSTKVGDSVLYGKYAGSEINIDGIDYLIMRESDIYAIV